MQSKSGFYPADAVVINADYAHAEMNLIDEKHRTYKRRYWEKRTIAPSAFILYLGVRRRLENLAHHNLFFHNDWQRHFRDIFNSPQWPETPSYYVCAPSKSDSSVAPLGCENLFLLVPVAPGLPDSAEHRESYADKILDHLESQIGEKFREHIAVSRTFSISDFANDYNAYKGTALGLPHTLMQSAFLRPAFSSKKVDNLFFTGQYTHPGIGVPMVLISAEISVTEMMKKFPLQKSLTLVQPPH